MFEIFTPDETEEDSVQLPLGTIIDDMNKVAIEKETVYGFEPVVDPSTGVEQS